MTHVELLKHDRKMGVGPVITSKDQGEGRGGGKRGCNKMNFVIISLTTSHCLGGTLQRPMGNAILMLLLFAFSH